jgi:hypothetical protein
MASGGNPIKRFMQGNKHVLCFTRYHSAHGARIPPFAYAPAFLGMRKNFFDD